jgi:hypothetical protein
MPGRKAIGPLATMVARGSLAAERVDREPGSSRWRSPGKQIDDDEASN